MKVYKDDDESEVHKDNIGILNISQKRRDELLCEMAYYKNLIEEHKDVMKVMAHALENAEESRKDEARKQSILRQQAEELKAVKDTHRS